MSEQQGESETEHGVDRLTIQRQVREDGWYIQQSRHRDDWFEIIVGEGNTRTHIGLSEEQLEQFVNDAEEVLDGDE